MATATERILSHRLDALIHLRRAVRCEERFVGLVTVTPHDLVRHRGAVTLLARTRFFYALALSTGRILSLDDSNLFRAACQLYAEVEAHCGDGSALAAGLADIASALEPTGGPEDWFPESLVPISGSAVGSAPPPVRTRIARAPDGSTLHEFWLGARPAFATSTFESLAFVEVVTSLLIALEDLYSRLLVSSRAGQAAPAPKDPTATSPQLSSVVPWPKLGGAADALARLDRRVKHYVVKSLTLEYEATAAARIAEELHVVAKSMTP